MKAALVTGAAGGIGGAVCAALSDAGYEVIGVDREQADLTDEAQVAAVFDGVDRLDLVVCAHGGSGRRFGDGPVDECTLVGWDATLAMNLTSVFRSAGSASRGCARTAAGRSSPSRRCSGSSAATATSRRTRTRPARGR